MQVQSFGVGQPSPAKPSQTKLSQAYPRLALEDKVCTWAKWQVIPLWGKWEIIHFLSLNLEVLECCVTMAEISSAVTRTEIAKEAGR